MGGGHGQWCTEYVTEALACLGPPEPASHHLRALRSSGSLTHHASGVVKDAQSPAALWFRAARVEGRGKLVIPTREDHGPQDSRGVAFRLESRGEQRVCLPFSSLIIPSLCPHEGQGRERKSLLGGSLRSRWYKPSHQAPRSPARRPPASPLSERCSVPGPLIVGETMTVYQEVLESSVDSEFLFLLHGSP